MRHRKGFNHLSRKAGHRKAMLANMASSLIKHKRIITTQAKAKALRGYVEPLLTKSKDDTTHSRRVVFSYLQDKDAVSELFREISPKIMDRPGGYTRILKMENRPGDNAEMAMIELVDFNENLLSEKKEKAAESTSGKRRRRGSKKKAAPAQEVEKTVVAEDVAVAEETEESQTKDEVENPESDADQKAEEEKDAAESKTDENGESENKDS